MSAIPFAGDPPEAFAIVPIRYDGLDAADHTIELNVLGESLQGMARIIAVLGNFAATQQYVKQYQAQSVRVLVREPKANCYSLDAIVHMVDQYQLFSGAGASLITALIGYLVSKASGKKAEMKAIKDSLDKAMALLANGGDANNDRLLTTIERMTTALIPAMRQAVAPVGKSCSSMTIANATTIDEATAEAIRSIDADEVGDEQEWIVRITELDRETASAKVRFPNDPEDGRTRAVITDPSLTVGGNNYFRAFAEGTDLRVIGKATLKDGEIATLYISNSIGTA